MPSPTDQLPFRDTERDATATGSPRRPDNSVQSEQSLGKKPAKRGRKAAAEPENSIRPSPVRTKSPRESGKKAEAPAEQATPVDTDSQAVPDHVRHRYIQVGSKYHFPDGEPAFRDRGSRLTTRSENAQVVRDLIAIAEERGWKSVTVSGTDRFRKEAWQQARLAGLSVRGYRASDVEQAQLARLAARERNPTDARAHEPADRETGRARGSEPETRGESPASAAVEERLYRGRLVDHGRANYQHDQHANMSYFVTIDTPSGERTLWGTDLERAIRESLSRVKTGDEVAVRHLGEKPVTIVRPTRNAEGTVTGKAEVAAYRNRWLVESREFLAQRAEVARVVRDPTVDPKNATSERPELVGTYVELRAAELVAKEVYADREDRQRFVTRVREAIAEEIERGQPLSAVRVREPAIDRDRIRSRAPERTAERVLS